VGGGRLDYSGNVTTSTADITTFKILINSTISIEDAAMMMMDIKNYYVGTPLPRYEYMIMCLSCFPEEIVDKYNLKDLAVDGWVYIEIRKGMYGLKHAGLLSNQLLQTLLAPSGYHPARHTPGLWLHKTRSIAFSLIVDDFAFKNVGKQHADHFRNALLQSYDLTTDWEAKVYSDMSLKWDYKTEHATFPCLAMFKMYSASSNMMPPTIRNTHRQNISRQCMGQKLNMQRKMKHLLSLSNSV
jgi:hypothetical protein